MKSWPIERNPGGKFKSVQLKHAEFSVISEAHLNGLEFGFRSSIEVIIKNESDPAGLSLDNIFNLSNLFLPEKGSPRKADDDDENDILALKVLENDKREIEDFWDWGEADREEDPDIFEVSLPRWSQFWDKGCFEIHKVLIRQ